MVSFIRNVVADEKKDYVKVRLYAAGDLVDEVILDETNA